MTQAACTPLLACVIAGSLLAPAARAHAILVDSTPAVHGAIPAGTQPVTLQFNSRIDQQRSRLTLLADGKPPVRLPIAASATADRMTAAADLAPGPYIIRWQVLAIDGHITRGDVPFTVTAP